MEQENFYNCIEHTDNFVEELNRLQAQSSEAIDLKLGRSETLEKLVEKYLRQSYTFYKDGKIDRAKRVLKIRFDKQDGFQWINSSASPPRENLNKDAANNVILVDFFTHCCINCMHSIEELRQIHGRLHEKFKLKELDANLCGFKVISIHSPKFLTEKQTSSISSSVQRMDLGHTEVLNDPNNKLWNQMGIFCWPTVLVLGPNPDPLNAGPNLLFAFTGEGKKEVIQLLSECTQKFASTYLDQTVVGAYLENYISNNFVVDAPKPKINIKLPSLLYFPGKVTLYQDYVCISDTGNHRLVIAGLDGVIQETVGGSGKGFRDGDFQEAKFYNPQGAVFDGDGLLYVADTGNHSIRRVDLLSRTVSTLVVPYQAVIGGSMVLMSPWDVCLYRKNALLVAAAGNHQILAYMLNECQLFGKTYERGTFHVIAGSGKEENRNNMYLLKASFAQPSGLACSVEGTLEYDVYIADSESSSIRCITGEAKVVGIAGGGKDPQDLFAYGDMDGTGADIKLQHPVGVAVGSSGVFVADTYNHKIKKFDMKSKSMKTIIGTNEPGDSLGTFSASLSSSLGIPEKDSPQDIATLNEPAGVALHGSEKYLFIADTNNHCIKVADLNSSSVFMFNLRYKCAAEIKSQEHFDGTFVYKMPPSALSSTFALRVLINNLPANFDGGSWEITSPVFGKPGVRRGSVSKDLSTSPLEIIVPSIPCIPWLNDLVVSIMVLFCGENACHRKIIKLKALFEGVADKVDDDAGEPMFTIDFAPNDANFFD